MDAPLLSIVTPCLNAARFLPRALASVASQPLGRGVVEHLIADGGSTDGSAELIAEHARRWPELAARWTSGPDGGQSAAINGAFAAARGEYGAWLNADDWYEPTALARVVAALGAPGAPDVLVGRCRFVDERGRVVFAPRPPEPISLAQLLRLRTRWFNGRSLVQPEVFFRLSLFRRVGGLNESNHHTMDYELWLRLLEAGATFATVDIDVACQGVHAGQKTADNREVVRSILGVARAAFERSHAALGGDEPIIRAELDGMAAKLAVADRVIPIWKRGLDGPRPEGSTLAARACIEAEASAAGGGSWLQGGDAADRVRALGRLLRRRTRWRGRLRVRAVVGADGVATAQFLGQLRGRLAEVELVAFAETSGRRASEAISASVGPADDALRAMLLDRGELRPAADAIGVDLVVVEDLLYRVPDPSNLVSELWDRLLPGGFLAVLAEPHRTPGLEPMLRRLVRTVSDRLSADDEALLSPEADAALTRLGEADADDWWAAHPGAAGVDLQGLLSNLAPRRGGVTVWPLCVDGYHPLAPFRHADFADTQHGTMAMALCRKARRVSG